MSAPKPRNWNTANPMLLRAAALLDQAAALTVHNPDHAPGECPACQVGHAILAWQKDLKSVRGMNPNPRRSRASSRVTDPVTDPVA